MKYPVYRIAVLDDVEADRAEIAEMTAEVCCEEKICPELFCYGSAEEFLNVMKQGQKFDLLLLDVMMPKQDGMELARYLRDEKQDEAIVFISNNREMALYGYEVMASRYLAKPLRKAQLKEAVEFCYGKKREAEKDTLLLPAESGVKKISAKEIYYVEINGRKCRIVQAEEEFNVRCSIREMEERLSGQGFIRCHQSFLVNCRYIRTVKSTVIELTGGKRIPVSKHRIKEVRSDFFAYMNC